jgi:hypothetical protein
MLGSGVGCGTASYGHSRLGIVRHMLSGMFTRYHQADFSVVKSRGKPLNQWRWEIYRAGRQARSSCRWNCSQQWPQPIRQEKRHSLNYSNGFR